MDTDIINFLNNNNRDLIQLYVNERQRNSNEEGILMLAKTEEKVNVSYYPASLMSKKLLDEYIKQRELNNNRTDIIHFYICESPSKAYFINIELRPS